MFKKNIKLSDFILLSGIKDEIKIKDEIIDGKKVSIVSCIFAKKDTFDSSLAREARGIVFDAKTGLCISRPFHKFFNVDENNYSLRKNIDWSNAICSTKHDGSMAIPVIINNKIFWRTKKSFHSDVAHKINCYWNSSELNQEEKRNISNCIYDAYKKDETVIFEFVSPNNRIVLLYENSNLRHLANRNIITGEYTVYKGFSVSKKTTLDKFISFTKEIKNKEGFVLYDKKDLYKIKTDWYLNRHKIISGLSRKFIVNATFNEEIDDIIALLKQMELNDLAKQIEIEKDKIINEYLLIYNLSHNCFKELCSIKDRKNFAKEILTPKYKHFSPYLFKLFDGKPIDNLIKKNLRKTLKIRNLGIGEQYNASK